jgi:hypothetical protein
MTSLCSLYYTRPRGRGYNTEEGGSEMKALKKIFVRLAADQKIKLLGLAALAAVAVLGYGDPKYYAFGYGDPKYYAFGLPGNNDIIRLNSGWGDIFRIIH